jgi:putative ABC transport system permease protein
MMRKKPALTAALLITLAIGIGATTAIYTVVYATLLAPLPYPQPDQLVMVWSKVQGHDNGISAGDFLDWKHQSSAFQDLNAFTGNSVNLAANDQPEQVSASLTTPGFYRMLGYSFLLGRDFLPEEAQPGKDRVVILTHKLWTRLGANPNIVGQTLRLNGTPHTVVGVLPHGMADRGNDQLMTPLAFRPDQINHDYHWLLAMGRLKPGVTLQQAQADMDGVAKRIAADYPKSNKGWGASVEPLKNDFLPRERIHSLWLLLGAVFAVLLIACANIANLLLANGTARRQEIAIRTSLGATRREVFSQFLTESLLLAFIGGTFGVGLGIALLRVLIAVMPPGTLPTEADLRLNLPILALGMVATLFSGIFFGCAPAWYASRVDPGESLKEGGRTGASSGRRRLRSLLVVGEFALALPLLAGAGLAVQSFWNLTRVDVGVRTDHVLTFALNPPRGKFENGARMDAYYQQILSALHSLAGVSYAAAVTGMPLRGTSDGMPFTLVGGPSYSDPSQRPGAGFQSVTPEYFKTFGIQVLKGRQFTSQDTATSERVAMVNQDFVNRYLKNKNPLNQRLSVEQIVPGIQQLGPAVEWQIVGVFHNVRAGNFRDDFPEIDVPFPQSPLPSINIGMRTAEDPVAMTRTVSAHVHAVDPAIALADVRTMDEVKHQSLADDRFMLLLYGSFAAVALLLAAVGIYGVMAFVVVQRRREIGLRMALGANRGSVIAIITREACLLALLGLALGFAGAVMVERTMQSTLYGVGTMNFSVIGAVAILLLVTAMLASYAPAKRAASIDPMQALRTE